MKKLIKDFASTLLSKEQLKSIKGGAVYCSFSSWGYPTGGSCADNNPSTCNLYCQNAGYTNCNCYPV